MTDDKKNLPARPQKEDKLRESQRRKELERPPLEEYGIKSKRDDEKPPDTGRPEMRRGEK